MISLLINEVIDNASKVEEDFDMTLSKSFNFCKVFNNGVSVVVLEMVGLSNKSRQVFGSVNKILDNWIKDEKD